MDKTLFWARSIGVDTLVFAAIAYGMLHPSAFVLNAALFYCWAYALLAIVAFPMVRQKEKEGEMASCVSEMRVRMYCSPGWKTYDTLTDIALPLMLSGFNYWVLAGLLLVVQLALKERLYRYARKGPTTATAREESPASGSR